MAEWRDPCPYRIVEDMGGAFSLGLIGGSMFTVAGRYGSNFAAWGMVFSASECAMIHIREKEDPINTITAGITSGAVLAMRQGRGAMIVSGIFGGLILGVMEGVMVMVNQYQLESQQAEMKRVAAEMEKRQKASMMSGEGIGRGWGGVNNEKEDDKIVKAL